MEKNIYYTTEKIKTPLVNYRKNIFIKDESKLPSSSFKWRGASSSIDYKMSSILTYSTGNFGLSTTIFSKKLGIKSYVIIPKDANTYKVKLIKKHGGIVIYDNNSATTVKEKLNNEKIKIKDVSIIDPYSDKIKESYGFIAKEIIEQLDNVSRIYVPIGSGALLSGVSLFLKNNNKNIEIVGVQIKHENNYNARLTAINNLSATRECNCDGLSVFRIPQNNYKIISTYVDRIIHISTESFLNFLPNIYKEWDFLENSSLLSIIAAEQDTFPCQGNKVVVGTGANKSWLK